MDMLISRHVADSMESLEAAGNYAKMVQTLRTGSDLDVRQYFADHSDGIAELSDFLAYGRGDDAEFARAFPDSTIPQGHLRQSIVDLAYAINKRLNMFTLQQIAATEPRTLQQLSCLSFIAADVCKCSEAGRTA